MKKLLVLPILVLLSAMSFGQSYNINIGGLSISSGASVPGSCPQNGALFFKTAATQGWYYCLAGTWTAFGTGSGTGDFSGPASSTNNDLVSFNGTGGKTGKDSGILSTNVSLISNRIDQNNAATTSAQLATTLSDEVGTGVVVLPPAPGAGDTLMGTTTNSTTLAFTAVPNCPGAAGYSTASHAFLCTISFAPTGTTSAVTVNGAVSTDQNLQTAAPTTGALNTVGRRVHYHSDGSYTTSTSGAGTMTFKVKACTVSGCGSGTVVTLATMGPTAAQSASAATMPWSIDMDCSTLTTGASGTMRCAATLVTVLGTTPTAVGGTYQSVSTSSTVDLTVAENMQITVADSGASANNSFTGNVLIINSIN